MLRSCLAAGVLTTLAVVAAGCFGSSTDLYPNGAECAEGTNPDCDPDLCSLEEVVDLGKCKGGVCLVFNENQQGIIGVCSSNCTVDEECTPHERCLSFPEGSFCLRACQSDSDCFDKTVCRSIPGTFTQFCLVDSI
ncbi:MAG: hypothetical protein IPK82_00380 [Polyangiaceae bacterium]|nr:hypothetical protein [Polyangiaceae bacterium]